VQGPRTRSAGKLKNNLAAPGCNPALPLEEDASFEELVDMAVEGLLHSDVPEIKRRFVAECRPSPSAVYEAECFVAAGTRRAPTTAEWNNFCDNFYHPTDCY